MATGQLVVKNSHLLTLCMNGCTAVII